MPLAQPDSVPLRLVFMGTAELASASLRALVASSRFQIAAVVSQPDRPKGRDLKPQPPPVKQAALELGLSVLQPERARHPDFIEQLRRLAPDLIVVAAYGQILPQSILDLPRHGCLNVHTSLLPRHRGAAPIQWAILEGDAETGITLMQMDAGLDTGPMVTTRTTRIEPTDNAQTLHDRLAAMGAALLIETIPDYVAGRITPRPQPAPGATYARKITREDGQLDWSQPARALWNRVRGLTPWPGTFSWLAREASSQLLKIWEAEPVPGRIGPAGTVLEAGKRGIVVACGADALNLLTVQREGGKRLSAADYLAGHPIEPGERFLNAPG
jgi:methionyl-tRNA formyltransferase